MSGLLTRPVFILSQEISGTKCARFIWQARWWTVPIMTGTGLCFSGEAYFSFGLINALALNNTL